MTIDIILPPAKTQWEAHQRWLNWMQSQMMPLHSDRKVIKVKFL